MNQLPEGTLKKSWLSVIFVELPEYTKIAQENKGTPIQ